MKYSISVFHEFLHEFSEPFYYLTNLNILEIMILTLQLLAQYVLQTVSADIVCMQD